MCTSGLTRSSRSTRSAAARRDDRRGDHTGHDQAMGWARETFGSVSGVGDRGLPASVGPVGTGPADAGQRVVRVPPKMMAEARASARTRGKSDPIDALAVARAVLREPDLPVASHDEVSRELKLLVDRREDLVAERTRMINRLRWRVHELDPGSRPPTRPSRWTRPARRPADRLAAGPAWARSPAGPRRAGRHRPDARQIDALEREITALVAAPPVARTLLAMPGCGALTAAKIVGETAGSAGSADEAKFAVHAGVAPDPGLVGRHRRPGPDHPHGQPQLNAALHRIAVTQIRLDEPGQAYYPAPRRRRLPHRSLCAPQTTPRPTSSSTPSRPTPRPRRACLRPRLDIGETHERRSAKRPVLGSRCMHAADGSAAAAPGRVRRTVPVGCHAGGASSAGPRRAAGERRRYPRALRATLTDLTQREASCCSFFRFALSDGDEAMRLEVAVPMTHTTVLDALAERAAQLARGTSCSGHRFRLGAHDAQQPGGRRGRRERADTSVLRASGDSRPYPGACWGGHRLYSPETVALLRTIKTAQRLGFTLDETSALLHATRHVEGHRHRGGLQGQAVLKLAEVEAKIADLTVIRDVLRRAVEAGCDDLTACASSDDCPLPFADGNVTRGQLAR